MRCRLCPANCNVTRTEGDFGRCNSPWDITAARAGLHMWEEPVISGINGSGTVFFSGCNLNCIFCQNQKIAKSKISKKISEERLVEIFFELEEKGAHNINLVTGSHYVVQIAKALKQAKLEGLSIPVVYNTSSYEKVNTLKLLDGLVDIYLPDLKYFSSRISAKYSNAPDYFKYASEAIKEMFRQTGKPVFYEYYADNKTIKLIKKGMIVRHLLLPDNLSDSIHVIKYLHDTFENDIFISIMNQYTPCNDIKEYPELMKKVSKKSYDYLVDYAVNIGVENGFIQEGETAKESFIPSFDYEGI